MNSGEKLKLLVGLPLSSSITREFFDEVLRNYVRESQEETERKKADDERRIREVLTTRWHRQGDPIWGNMPLGYCPPEALGKDETSFDVFLDDWALATEIIPIEECLAAGLSLDAPGVFRLSPSHYCWGVKAWLHRSFWSDRYKAGSQPPLPLPKENRWTDCSRTPKQWIVIFAAIADNLDRPNESSTPLPPNNSDHPTFVRMIRQRGPIQDLIDEFEKAPSAAFGRFETGRGIVIEMLRRECFNRSLEKVRSDGVCTHNLVASDGERPEFLPVWHSPHGPEMDTPQAFGQWLTCTRRALDHWMASFPSPVDCDDDVSRALALQALEDADTLARHLRDHHGINSVPQRPTDESLSAVKRFLDDVVQAIAERLRGRKPESRIIDTLHDDARMTHLDLATALSVEPEPLRSRLDRWRSKNAVGWEEVTEPKPRQPKYLYRVGNIRDLLREAMSSSPATD